MNWHAKWIKPAAESTEAAIRFSKTFSIKKEISKAVLYTTALGVYEASLNNHRISDYVLAPGWTSYHKRLQYQNYDVTELLSDINHLEITVGKGWYRGDISGRVLEEQKKQPCGLLAELVLTYIDGTTEFVSSGSDWLSFESKIRYSEIYHGEFYDAAFTPSGPTPCKEFNGPWETLIPQEGEKIMEHERFFPARIFTTPKGEKVIDFGQNLTGYVEISLTAKKGQRVSLSHGEVLDSDGNFYNANYRAAKAKLDYLCTDGFQTYHPHLTFYGFRYVRIDEFPDGLETAAIENFSAIAVYSDIKQTGFLSCSHPLLNQFFKNVVWGQKDNFLDIPTDCPQRDERLGWTGDAQIFIRAAALNFDVEKFFSKWLGCMRAEQWPNGYIGHMIPDTWHFDGSSAAWGDAAIICPWELYMAYGNSEILEQQFECMKKRIDYITNDTKEPYLWIGGIHFGDWLGLDGDKNSLRGGSRDDLIASAYYAYSTLLFVKAGKILGKDVAEYELLYQGIKKAFQEKFSDYHTQTECAIAVHFRLAKDCQATADQLAAMLQDSNLHLTTGFVGTPYLLHALSDFGHAETAYSLLLREEYPSWLYSVKKGATTVWEHWDSLREDGTFWDTSMNSFNHYSYGSVIDWVYCVCAGIRYVESAPGYEQVIISPIPDKRLGWLKAELDTRHGKIISYWTREENFWRYEITTPVCADIIIDGKTRRVSAGSYCFYSSH